MVKVFKCLLCGETCCSFKNIDETPLVFPWEKRILEEKASMRGVKLEFKPYIVYDNGSSYIVALYRWIIRGRCPFLNNNGMCSIHREKPLSCKIYPLIIGWGDNTLRVSAECPWIRDNIDYIRGEDPSKIFPEEFKYAVQVLSILKQIDDIARRNKWRKKIYPGDDKPLVDIDEIYKPL